jgi:hypothetical protein
MNLLTDSSNEYEYVPNELGKLLPNQLSPMKSIPSSPAVNRGQRVNLQLRFRELVGVTEIPKRSVRMLRKLGDGAFGSVRYPNLILLYTSDAIECITSLHFHTTQSINMHHSPHNIMLLISLSSPKHVQTEHEH